MHFYPLQGLFDMAEVLQKNSSLAIDTDDDSCEGWTEEDESGSNCALNQYGSKDVFQPSDAYGDGRILRGNDQDPAMDTVMTKITVAASEEDDMMHGLQSNLFANVSHLDAVDGMSALISMSHTADRSKKDTDLRGSTRETDVKIQIGHRNGTTFASRANENPPKVDGSSSAGCGNLQTSSPGAGPSPGVSADWIIIDDSYEHCKIFLLFILRIF